jgi:hypothetical protein
MAVTTQKRKTTTYLGNPKLKRSGVQTQWTPEQIVEYAKCAVDSIYFIETYCKIVHVDKGLINFNLHPFQKDMIKTFVDNRFVICKMPRQVGKTTTTAGYILWEVLFHEYSNVAILANKDKKAREILDRIQKMYENLPKWLQQGVTEWNKGNIELENGSKIVASATSASAARGDSYSLVYLDEFAHVEKNVQDEFFTSVYPTISSGQNTKLIITSTPLGMEMFYKIWVEAEEGRNKYVPVSINWWDVPGRDEKWKEQELANIGQERFNQEYNCEFLGSSNTLIHPTKLRALTHKTPKISNELGLKEYYPPEEDVIYAIVVDTSRGVGGDASAFIVFNVNTFPYKICCTFKSNLISPLIYPNIIHDTAKRYNDALILVETNDIGQQVADILHHDLEYEGVLVSAMSGRSGQSLSGGFAYSAHKGVRTTKQVKRIGCSTLKTLVEADKLLIEDYDTIYELSRFVQKKQSYEADTGNDDLVMCCVLFSWLTAQPYFKEITDIDIRKKIYEQNENMLIEEMMPFGVYSSGDDEEDMKINESPMLSTGKYIDEFSGFLIDKNPNL